MSRFNTYTMSQAKIRANAITTDIKFMNIFIKEINKAISIMDKFDGKVYNARFDNFIKENTLLSIGSRGMYSFTINMYDYKENGCRQSITENVVYNFYSMHNKHEQIRIYNKETNCNDKFVALFKQDDNTRMNIDGWKELFNSVADKIRNTIKEQKPYTNAEKIYKASIRETKICEQIRELENKRLKALPFFLR